MISVLLVDDEIRTVRGLTETVPWGDLGVDTILTATNGVAALGMVAERTVDIIITDIRMPRMDGLEFARQAADLRPQTVIVFLTALSQFELAKSALQVRALDYILKPVDVGEVIDVVSNAVAEVHRRHAFSEIDQRERAFALEALRDVASDRSPDSDAWSVFCHGADAVGIVAMRQLGKSAELSCHGVATELSRQLHTAAPYPLVVEVSSDTAMVCCTLRGAASCDDWIDDVLVDAQRMVDRVEADDPGSVLGVGVATGGREPSSVRAAMEQALDAAECALTHDTRRVSRRVEHRADEPEAWMAVQEQLESCPTDDLPSASRALDAVLAALDRATWFRLTHMADLIRSCIAVLLSAATRAGLREHRGALAIIAQLEECATLGELRTTIVDIGTTIDRPTDATIGDSPVVHRICEYVEHALDRPISLAEVAAEVELSPSYVSTLFRRDTGESLLRFVARRKIEAAKRLLTAESHLPVSEIAERCGYSDYRYFTRVFKRITGVTPTEFARGQRGGP